jgi:DNA-binding GntR family transcriptional regulator
MTTPSGRLSLPRARLAANGLADEVAFRLQAAILEGELAPGTHIAQEDLCHHWGISRTPVREALRILQAQHLVELVANKGARVRVVSRQETLEVYALRAQLEGYACELAVPTLTDHDFAVLDEAIDEMHDVVGPEADDVFWAARDPTIFRRLVTANDRFHQTIHLAAGNERLVQLTQDLQSAFPKDYFWRSLSSAQQAHVAAVDEHVAVKEALQQSDAAAARVLMIDHITCAGDLLVSYLDAHHLWD